MALEPKTVSAVEEENPELADMSRRFWIGGMLALPVFLLAMAHFIPALRHESWVMGETSRWTQFILSTPVVMWAGWPFFKRGWRSLVTWHLNMFTLIAIGVATAYLFSATVMLLPGAFPASFAPHGKVGIYFESAAVIIVLVLLGQILEMKARGRASSALRKLIGLTPATARLVLDDGREDDVALELIQPGDHLRVRPGRIRDRGRGAAKPKSFVGQVMRAARKAGHTGKGFGRQGNNSGSRFGRGRSAALALSLRSPSRRVVIKARVVRPRGNRFSSAPLAKHVSYLKRDGITRDGAEARMFDARSDVADGRAFAERCEEDRHHFRFIVSPEDAAEMTDLRAFTRELMLDAERDLGTKLDWVAVDHWNTDNLHIHVLVRGRADDGQDLVISRDYISRGFRARAEERVTLELGPRSEREIRSGLEKEVEAERWTNLDRALRSTADEGAGIANLRPSSPDSDPELRRRCGHIADICRGLKADAKPVIEEQTAHHTGEAILLIDRVDGILHDILSMPLGSRDEYNKELIALSSSKVSIFIPGAFTRHETVAFALKLSLCATICYIIVRAVDWPGISTSVITVLITGLSTSGAIKQKLIFRLVGSAIGGLILGMGATIYLFPHMDSISSLVLLIATVSMLAAWWAGGRQFNYVGLQIAFAFYLVAFEGFSAPTQLAPSRDRLVGILLALFVMAFVFDLLWPVRTVTAMRASLAYMMHSAAEYLRLANTASNIVELRHYADALRDQIGKTVGNVRTMGETVLRV